MGVGSQIPSDGDQHLPCVFMDVLIKRRDEFEDGSKGDDYLAGLFGKAVA